MAQAGQCYLNVGTALAEVGATFDDVAELAVYLVDWAPEKVPLFVEGAARAAAALGITALLAPLTGIGVAALAEADVLVEVEAAALTLYGIALPLLVLALAVGSGYIGQYFFDGALITGAGARQGSW